MAGQRKRFAGERFKFIRGGFEIFQLAAGNDDIGAGRRQSLGNGFADAASTAGDDGHFSCEVGFAFHPALPYPGSFFRHGLNGFNGWWI